MKYLLLIYDNEATAPEVTQEELAVWFKYDEEVRASGTYLGGQALKETATATTVRKREGKVLTVDGPFAETKEQLGGYYVLEAKDLDEAIAWAAKMPHIGRGSVEIRPVMEFDMS